MRDRGAASPAPGLPGGGASAIDFAGCSTADHPQDTTLGNEPAACEEGAVVRADAAGVGAWRFEFPGEAFRAPRAVCWSLRLLS